MKEKTLLRCIKQANKMDQEFPSSDEKLHSQKCSNKENYNIFAFKRFYILA